MEEIERNLTKRTISKEEIDRIAKLKFTPNSPEGYREFDPSETANLFEKGISPPKFTNPSLWFVKGPLKWLIVQFVKLYSIFDKKVSQNRIHAFYSVVHELILLKKSQRFLSERFDQLYKEHTYLKSQQALNITKNVYVNRNSVEIQFIQKSDSRILDLVDKKSSGLILYPEWNGLLTQLKTKFVSLSLLLEDKFQEKDIDKSTVDRIFLVESIPDFLEYQNYSFILFQSNVCFLPPYLLEKILMNIYENANPKTQIFLRYSNTSIDVYSPFQRNHLTHIDKSLLLPYLKDIGFQNIIVHQTDLDEFKLLSFSK